MQNAKAKSMSAPLASFSFTKEDLRAYREFSKDENPIHESGVVYGILLMARIEGFLTEKLELAETRALTYRFLAKVMIKKEVQLFVEDQDFEVWCCGEKVGEGRIENV